LFQRTLLTGLAVSLLVVQACGSDDGKKKVQAAPDGGMGGEAGHSGSPDMGGSMAGAPAAGQPPVVVTGGAGGAGGEAPLPITAGAGAGGEPPVYVPDPELLFSVKAGAEGLDGTAISSAAYAQNLIYTSKTGSQSDVDGTNEVKITGEALGLAADDEIVAFALPQVEPQNPLYLFSLADGSEGAYTARSYWFYQNEGTAQSQLFYSDGVQSYRDLGEGGDEYGYNALFASESSLGLSPGPDGPADDLTGMAVHDAKQPITEVYFTVGSAAAGADGSAVAGVAAAERSCTLFKSDLDGQNSIAYSCADLGLLPGDRLDALTIYEADDSVEVVFSVGNGAQGALGSGVEAARLLTTWIGATLFKSPGDATNAVLKNPEDFALTDHTADDIDGLAIIDQPKASVTHGGSCQLSYDPLDAVNGGGLTFISGTSWMGSNVLFVYGQNAAQSNQVLAYNASTCAFLQQRALPAGFEYPRTFTALPLTGWSAAKPLDKVEYLMAAFDQGFGKELRSYDAAGAYLATYAIGNTDYTSSVERLVYEPVGDQLYLILSANYYGPQNMFTALPRPDGTNTLTADFKRMTQPCANGPDVVGTDSAGNLYVARQQAETSGIDYRVCAFAPNGELLPMPYGWTSDTQGNTGGFIVPGGGHYLLHSEASPITIERGAFQAP
jgi:hypothetical protein